MQTATDRKTESAQGSLVSDLRRNVPRPVAVAVIVGALLVFGVISILRLDRIRGNGSEISDLQLTVPLFIEPSQVDHSSRFTLSFNPPGALAPLRTGENLDGVVAGAVGDEHAFRKLMTWTRAQWEIGRPDPYPPLDARVILAEIRAQRTGGFCAQYCYVLVQAIQSFGRRARHVSIRDHEIVEAWLEDEGRWVMLDPTYELLVENADGRSLSVIEIQSAAAAGEQLAARSGNCLEEPLASYLDRYRRFAVWLRNDHVVRPLNFRDLWRYRVWYAPEEVEPPLGRADLWTPYAEDLYP